jgi:hypothetical protein
MGFIFTKGVMGTVGFELKVDLGSYLFLLNGILFWNIISQNTLGCHSNVILVLKTESCRRS